MITSVRHDKNVIGLELWNLLHAAYRTVKEIEARNFSQINDVGKYIEYNALLAMYPNYVRPEVQDMLTP